MMNFLLGFIFSLIIAGAAYKRASLSKSGFYAALVVGTLIYGFGTYIIFSLLMVFFISSSVLTKLKKTGSADQKEGRTYIQVLANSAAAFIFSIAYYFTHESNFLLVAAIGIAACNSDTWASEIGKLTKGKTLSILSFKIMPQGESGGVSLLGIFAAMLGSLLIAFAFGLLYITRYSFNTLLLINIFFVFAGGFLGCIIDSYLGILIQAKYFDKISGKIVETVKDHMQVHLISGFSIVNNDMVNFLSTFAAAVIFAFIVI